MLANQFELPKTSRTAKSLLVRTALFLAAVIAASYFTAFSPVSIFFGLADVAEFISFMVPPDFAGLESIVRYTLETLAMAFLGTIVGAVIAIPLSFLMSEGVHSHSIIRQIARVFSVLTRAVPDLLIAYLAVAVLGIGPTAGTIALAVSSIGMISKLLSTAIETTNPKPIEAMRATGASRAQIISSGYLPGVLPTIISTLLYRFDINLRASAILGLVGAGGIGLLLRSTMGSLDYQGALAVVIVLFTLLLMIETISIEARKLVIQPSQSRFFNHTLIKRSKALPPITVATVRNWLIALAVVALTIWSAQTIAPNFDKLFATSERMSKLIAGLITPNFDGLLIPLLETLGIAVLSTFYGGFIGIVIGVLAAKTTSINKFLYFAARTLMVGKRGFPTIILALFFVPAVGLGPTAGIYAMSLGTGIIFAKFLADSLEELDQRPSHAVLATGASRTQALISATLPQVLPTAVSHYLYCLDINVRYSTILGIVGAGGIGYELLMAMRAYDFHSASAIVIIIFVVVLAIEYFSKQTKKLLS